MLGVVEGFAASVVLEVVKGLIQAVMKEVVSPLWERDKNARKLQGMLTRLDPIISDIDMAGSSGPQRRSTQAWLEDLRSRLEAVQKVLLDNKNCGHLGKLSASKKLSEETALLNGLCGEAALVGLQSTVKIHDKVTSMEELLRQSILSTSVPSPSSSGSAVEIKEALVAKLRRQDTMTVFGGDRVIEEARKMLLEHDSGWCGLWASGGAGKTHAAQRIFNDMAIQAHFKGGCYWLTVGQSKTTRNVLCDLRKSVVEQPNPPASMSDMDLKNLLLSELRDREKVLVVLDDVWNQDLSMLDVMRGGAGCKVLVTTRNKEVLDKQHAAKLEVPLLSFDDSWRLFCRHAWQDVSHVPPELESIAKDITRECKGLPLALKVIGGGCAGKRNLREWMLAYERVKSAEHCDLNVKLFLQLKPSVDELENIPCAHLKDCFLYFAAFPEDYEADVERDLFPLWFGEGIVGKKYDPMLEAWEKLGFLTSRSLVEMHSIEDSDIGVELIRFKVHDVLRDLARYLLQMNTCIEKRDCLYEAGEDLRQFPKEWVPNFDGGDVSLSAHRLSVMYSKVEVLPPKLLPAPKLEVMILRGNPIKAIPDGFFRHNLGKLRVLDLSHTDIASLPRNLGNLEHLVVLNLEWCEKLTKLPSSLGELTNLKLLNLGCCRKLAYLPRSLFLLYKLQYLTVKYSTLDVWKKVGVTSRVLKRRGTLKDLNHLVALKQVHIGSSSVKSLPSGIFKALKELRVLCLEFHELVAIPENIADELQHLEELSLGYCERLTSLPCSFGLFLKNLHTLDLSYCNALRSLPESFSKAGAFPVLKKLYMVACSSMVSFPEVEPGAMPQLEILSLRGWDQLVDFPKVVGTLTKLRVLDLAWCFNLRSLEHDGVGVESLTSLERLVLRRSKEIRELPVGLVWLPRLRRIDMRVCPAAVPTELEERAKHGRMELCR